MIFISFFSLDEEESESEKENSDNTLKTIKHNNSENFFDLLAKTRVLNHNI